MLMILRSIIMAYSTCRTEYRSSRALLTLLGLLPLLSTLLLLPRTGAEGTSNCNLESWDPNSEGARVGGEPCPCPLVDPQMHPTHEIYYGQDVVWQIPPHPKAILYFAPGADQTPFGSFDKGPNCHRCFGLPEHRAMTLEALKRGYAVIVVQSVGIAFESWPLEESEDFVIVGSVIIEWTRKHSLESLPLLTWGHSAGAKFVTSLTLSNLPIRAQVLSCSPGEPHVVENTDLGAQFPPTFFAYMPMDETTLNNRTFVERAISILQKRGVEVATKQSWPKPLSPLFFTERILCMSNATSEKIFMAFKAAGWLDTNGYLVKNPHWEDWRAVMMKWNPLPVYPDSGDCHLTAFMLQELEMADAKHGFTSDANEEIFSWLESLLFMRDPFLNEFKLDSTILSQKFERPLDPL